MQSRVSFIVKQQLFRVASRLQESLERWQTETSLSSLKRRGDRISVDPTVRFIGSQYIEVGDDTILQPYLRIEAVDYYGSSGQRFQPKLKIGARCSIEYNVHISACYCVEIGNDVMIAGRAYISDHVHRYDDPTKPVRYQPLSEIGGIVIGNGCHIGEGACIFSNVTLGDHVVVGANAVVTKNIPSFCIAAGVPARILRHYDFEHRVWVAGPPSIPTLQN